jgi:aspartokinase/homoserine dehydrogenase 1
MKKFIFRLFIAAIAILPAFICAQSLHVFLVGPGGVGNQLIEQIERNHSYFQDQYGIDIRIVAIASSKKMVFNREGISLSKWRIALEEAEPMSWESFQAQMTSMDLPRKVFVDCTSDQTIANAYISILEAGIAISTPNKKVNSSVLENYQKLKELSRDSKFFYDANVGAALPIVSSVQSLRRSGDEIIKIEGIFSGTLSYIFNSFKAGTAFSDIVKDAQNKGYTEPDPRDDLNGMDAARKLLILCREAGFSLEMKDVDIQRFLPDDCFDAPTVDVFYAKLTAQDALFADRINTAESKGQRLCYIASFENGKARLSLQAVGSDHPFYHLSGADNIVAITTKYYNKSPLVIKGPGAGLELTAAKVLEGIIKIGLFN